MFNTIKDKERDLHAIYTTDCNHQSFCDYFHPVNCHKAIKISRNWRKHQAVGFKGFTAMAAFGNIPWY